MQNREQGESYETMWAQAVQACADGKYQEAVDKAMEVTEEDWKSLRKYADKVS